jgi:hypothetical protein
MLKPEPFPRQILIEAEIEGGQPGRLAPGPQAWGRPSPCPAPREDRGQLAPPPAVDPPPSATGGSQPHSQPDGEVDREADRAAGGAATAQLLRLPVHSVRFLQAMAEYGAAAHPVRIGANPPEGHVLFHSFSD